MEFGRTLSEWCAGRGKLGRTARAELARAFSAAPARALEDALDIAVSSSGAKSRPLRRLAEALSSLGASAVGASARHLLVRTHASDAGVRSASWALLAETFRLLYSSSGGSSDDSVAEDVAEAAATRGTHDRSAAVREAALTVLRFCSAAEGEAVRCLADASPGVRLAAVAVLRSIPRSLVGAAADAVLLRTRDVSCDVRQSAYSLLCAAAASLSHGQMRALLRNGLADPAPAARKAFVAAACRHWTPAAEDSEQPAASALACAKLCRTALPASFGVDQRDVDVPDDAGEAMAAELALHAAEQMGVRASDVFESLLMLDPSSSSSSSALLRGLSLVWRGVSMKDAREDPLSATEFCSVLSAVRRDAFATRQILCSTPPDMADEAGRRSLLGELCSLLSNSDSPRFLLSPAAKLLCLAAGDAEELCQSFASVLSALANAPPVPRDAEWMSARSAAIASEAKLADELGSTRDDSDTALAGSLDLSVAAEELRVELSLVGAGSWEKWRQLDAAKRRLIVSEPFLQAITAFRRFPEELARTSVGWTVREVVLPAIGSESPALRRLGIGAFGVACTADRKLASEHFLLFNQVVLHDAPAVRIPAIAALFDFLLLFSEDDSGAAFCRSALALLESSACLGPSADRDVRRVVHSGFLKLIHSGVFPGHSKKVCCLLGGWVSGWMGGWGMVFKGRRADIYPR